MAPHWEGRCQRAWQLNAIPLEELDGWVQALAEKLTHIPLTQLIAMKLVVNRAYDSMGLQGTQTLRLILDGTMCNTR